MTRTGRAPKNTNTAAGRRSQISHSLTRLLRHQAENENVPITPAGWVKLDDLLAWKGLGRVAKDITVAEIFEVVEEDGRTGKGRFGVEYVGEAEPGTTSHADENESTNEITEATSKLNIASPINASSKNTPETQSALHHHTLHPSTPASHYKIRATQGHSIKSVGSADLLSPIDLSDPSTLPTTVVHGTFYGAWTAILSTGGLKSMSRNNVHFATGPSLDEVLSLVGSGDDRGAMGTKSRVDEVLSANKVISGMRWDAQLLIYVDLRRCLDDVARRGLDMTWWTSGNGVVLTEGVVFPEEPQLAGPDEEVDPDEPIVASKQVKAKTAREKILAMRRARDKIVPMEYWDCVVEIKNGLGVVWRHGEGVVKELPERLRSMPVPQGKARGGGRGGRGGKPRLNVERGDVVDNGEEGEE